MGKFETFLSNIWIKTSMYMLNMIVEVQATKEKNMLGKRNLYNNCLSVFICRKYQRPPLPAEMPIQLSCRIQNQHTKLTGFAVLYWQII